MPNTIISTIGSGGQYPDLATWFAAAPASLVAADEIWEARLLNQEFSKTSSHVTLSGKTVDATRYFVITAAPGASFKNHATASSNPLRYDPTKGAALKVTAVSSVGIDVSLQYTRIRGLQFFQSSTSANTAPAIRVTVDNCDIEDCIAEGYCSNTALRGVIAVDGASNVRNCVIVQRKADAAVKLARLAAGARAINCTMVATGGTPLTVGIETQYAAATLKNVYVGGVVAPEDGVVATTKTACHSNATATGYTTTPLSAVTFENVTDGTHDFRLTSGSALLNAGTTDASNAATDIMGKTRPQGTAYDVGAWEYPAPVVADTTAPVLEAPAATATGSTTASGTVATNEAGGLLYYRATANSTETAATIKTGSSQSVNATGTQTVNVTGLTAGTAYYLHYVQDDAAGNTSNVVSSPQFNTPAADAVAPTFAAGAAITPGTITATSIAGTYPAASDNVAVARYWKSKDGGTTWEDNGSGQSFTFNGLTASTAYPVRIRAQDAAGNYSAALQLSMTTSAGTGGSGGTTSGTLTTQAFKNGTGQILANLAGLNVAVLSLPGLASVKTFSGRTTNASGVNTVSDAAIVAGTKYAHITTNADGTVIGAELITAT